MVAEPEYPFWHRPMPPMLVENLDNPNAPPVPLEKRIEMNAKLNNMGEVTD